jgi:hypothetical protein
MAKKGLGRDLGTLMGGQPKDGVAPLGAGVDSLMRGHKAPAPRAAPDETLKSAIPRWYLFAGDVLLVVLALLTIYKSPHPLSWQREVFCAALVMLAAGLAVVAILAPRNKGGQPPG